MKYRKKPVVVEAFQMTEANARDREKWPPWLLSASQGLSAHFCCDGPKHILIGTPEGRLNVSLGDWIIQGVMGELYPCKPDIFEMTYEAVGV